MKNSRMLSCIVCIIITSSRDVPEAERQLTKRWSRGVSGTSAFKNTTSWVINWLRIQSVCLQLCFYFWLLHLHSTAKLLSFYQCRFILKKRLETCFLLYCLPLKSPSGYEKLQWPCVTWNLDDIFTFYLYFGFSPQLTFDMLKYL